MFHVCLSLFFLGLLQSPALPVQQRAIEYRDGNLVLEGTLIHPARGGKLPGLLLIHEDGATATQAVQRARSWAERGYVVLAVDLFGKGKQPKALADAGRLFQALRGNSANSRLKAALHTLRQQPQVNGKKLALVGYGLGATAALDFARTGAEVEGIVCLHGDLPPGSEEENKRIKAELLFISGTDDPKCSLSALAKLEESLKAGGVDWQVLRLGGVAGGFTNPQSGNNLKAGVAYDALADERAAEFVRGFLVEVFSDEPEPAKANPPVAAKPTAPAPKPASTAPANIPEKVLAVLRHVDEHGEAKDGYEGGRRFGNFEQRLPKTDRNRRPIKYREWDVNPLRPGVNRGPERLVTGSDGSAWFTRDHYETFTRIR